MNLSTSVRDSRSDMLSLGHTEELDAMLSIGHKCQMDSMEPSMADRKPMQLRLPKEVKDWLHQEAHRNASSQNSEVIRALRERMERTTETDPA